MKRPPRPDHVIPVDVYAATVNLWFDNERFKQWREARGLGADAVQDSGVYGCAYYDTDPKGVSWFSVYFQPGVGPEIVAHEAVHLAQYILHVVGIKLAWDNHEALAYLVQFLTAQILARLPA